MSLIEGTQVIRWKFQLWKGESVADDYNGKAILDYKGQPLFAELVALRKLDELGYEGVWVDTYRKKFRIELPEKSDGVELPIEIQKKLNVLIEANNGIAGCWDLLLWKDDEILFVELKRKGKDAIRGTQIKWLENALSKGYSPEAFQIIEWDIVE